MGAQGHSSSSVLEDVVLPDRYRIVRSVARGGMASVWCAHDAVLHRRVAIKLLAEQFIHDDRAVRRFQREARAAARLSAHPNVITIFDVGQTIARPDGSPPRPFIVMEYLAGGTVGDALRVGAVEPADAIRWIAEGAAALDFAHERGVVHRDLKPGNLLLDLSRVLHVADFGIARLGAEATITATGQLFGTAAYISPEQALGRPATEASDRYALAVVAFELLTGERPFIAQHFAVQARQHIEREPPRASERNPGLPAAVDLVLARGMAKRPDDRWPTAREFARALEAALAGAAVPPRRPRPHRQRETTPPPLSIEPHSSAAARGPRPRIIALTALATAAFGVGAALGASTAGSSGPAREASRATTAASHRLRPATGPARRHPTATPAANRPAASHEPTTTATATTSTQQTTTGAPAAATAAPPTAQMIEARGHQLMLDGEYSQAIGVLHHALAAADPGSVTYAYALFDLGRSLRLSGDLRAAAVVLQQRLQIPNQTDVVRQELQLALRELGQQVNGSGGAATGPPASRRTRHARVAPQGPP